MPCVSVMEVQEGLSLDECWHALPQWKVEQYRKAKNARFRESSCLGYLMAIVLAARLPESSLEMVRTASGKPVFKNAPGIQFSISHSGGYVACALSGLPIGIDIEDASRDFTGITGHILSEDEFSCYSKLDHSGRNRFICAIWTLKEALGKYRGCGLAYDLKTVSFEICDDEAILSGSGETLHFETLSIGDSHLLSVCSEEPGPVSCRFDSPKELVAAGKRRSLW